MLMHINWTGVIVFTGFCMLLWAVTARPAWMPLAEGIVTMLILLGLAGVLVPKNRKRRDA
jgi:hypothetical protein